MRCMGIVWIVVLLILPAGLLADVPQTISHQGILTDEDGVAVPDDDYQLMVRLYTTPSDGTPLWTETHTVQTEQGIFHVMLGSQSTLDLPFDQPYWLGMSVEGGAELVPRVALAASPYALRAAVADDVSGGYMDQDWLMSGLDVYRLSGNVGILTNEPNGPLHVESDININDGSNFEDRVASLIVGDGDGTGKALLIDSNQIEQAAGVPEQLYLNYNSNSSVAMVMGGGSVGIGTHTPDERLDVVGTVRAQGLQITTSPTAGHVLTSDDQGFAAWHPAGELTLPFEDTVTENGQSAFKITNAGAGGGTVGLHGATGSYPGIGVKGEVYSGWGVYGICPSAYGYLGGFSTGAYGKDTGTDHSGSLGTNDYGVYGEGPNEGVRGYNTDAGTYGILGTDLDGIYGYCDRDDEPWGAGVYGYAAGLEDMCLANAMIATKGADGPTAFLCGKYGDWSPGVFADGYARAGVFGNSIQVYGGVYKTICNFEIDHPLDPLNKVLRHTSVESPEPVVIYRGKAQLDAGGEAVITLPGYFVALTMEDEATVTLTSIGRPFPVGYEWEARFASFRAYGEAGREISWVVYADRDDPAMEHHRHLVEAEKGPGVGCPKGKLLDPTAYGYPEEMGVGHEERQQLRERAREMHARHTGAQENR